MHESEFIFKYNTVTKVVMPADTSEEHVAWAASIIPDLIYFFATIQMEQEDAT